MASSIEFRRANANDWAVVAQLLQSAHLPLEGAQANLANFITAWRGSTLLGCIGLEVYGRTGLLRSAAVKESERGNGLGLELTRRLLSQARADGLQQMILLTETAQGFFPKFGFEVIERSQVPSEALASVEFTTACPDSAIVMRLGL
jgi:amino-acid N-acetyltransferase